MRTLISSILAALCVAFGLSSAGHAEHAGGWGDRDRQTQSPPPQTHNKPGWTEPRRDDPRRPDWSNPDNSRPDGEDHRSDYVDNLTEFVPLQLRGGSAANVDHVYLNVGGRVLSASAKPGVMRNDQNRLDWSGLPGVGQLAEHRYRRSDFDPSREIGEAYFDRGVVWLDLSDEPRHSTYREIVFTNQDFAYRMAAQPAFNRDIDIPARPPGREIGKVFLSDHGQLLVLVRPFIVTDSLF